MNIPFPRLTWRSLPKLFAVALAMASAIFVLNLRGDEPALFHIPYPAGYREWVHVKSGILGPEFPAEPERGVHHVYANKTALAGFDTGTFEDGSIIVYDLVSLDLQGSGVMKEGARRRIDVMVKDSKLYADSGGWGFGRFMGDDHAQDVLTADVRKSCVGCHEKQKAHGFVFSEFRK